MLSEDESYAGYTAEELVLILIVLEDALWVYTGRYQYHEIRQS